MTNHPPTTEAEGLKRDIISELTNAYYETYRYERPNDTSEQLIAFCRDLASNEVDELLQLETAKAVREARIDEIKMFQQVLRGGKLPVVASLFDKRIAELQKESE